MSLPGTFPIKVPMLLRTKDSGMPARIVTCTSMDYVVQYLGSGREVNMNSAEIHEWFEPVTSVN